MPKVSAERLVPGSLAEVWDLYFEPTTWPAWVDEFRAIEERDDVYPERGGVLTWRSGPAGRGRVTETVLDHEPRHTHRVSYMDPNSSGQQLTSFEIAGDAVKVRIELSYELSKPTFLPFTDRFFIRPQMEGSIVRSLEGLVAEAQEFAL